MLFVALLALSVGDTRAQAGAPAVVLDEARLSETYRTLTAQPHRLVGTAEGEAAGDAILRRLREAGFGDSDLCVQRFAVTQAVLGRRGAYFERDGQRYEMAPLRPNGLALPVTPPDGITGETVYLGNGDWSHFEGKALAGRIAVMELDCGDRWLRAFSEGASAVVFIGPGGSTTPGRQWLQSSTPLPRFFVDREVADRAGLLRGSSVRLFCEMAFQRRTARNIFALVPGTDPARANDVVSLVADYDTLGAVPFRSPSTRQAANVAGVVEAAAYLRANPLPGPVLLAFFDANAQDGYGQLAMQFARASYKGGADVAESLARWIAQREAEERSLREKLDLLANARRTLDATDGRPGAAEEREQLRAYIVRRHESVTQRRMELVLERTQLQRLASDGEGRAADAPAAGERTGELEARIDAITRDRDEMAKLRRAMAEGRIEGETLALLEEAVAGRRGEIEVRLAEVARELDEFRSHLAFGRFIGDRTIRLMAFANIAPIASAWTVAVPSTSPQTKMDWREQNPVWVAGNVPELVAKAPLSRWIAELPAGTWPNFGGAPRFVGLGETWRWRVSAQAHYALELGSLGTPWPARWSPAEPSADLAGFTPRFTEAVSFFTALARHDEVGRIATPAAVGEFYFRVPNRSADGRRYDGNVVRRYAGTSAQANEPAANTVVLIRPHMRLTEPSDDGSTWGHYTSTTTHGTFTLIADFYERAMILAADHDEQGGIRAMTQLQPGGRNGGAGKWDAPGWFLLRRDNILVMFDARPVSIWHAWRPFHEGWEPGIVRLLQAVNDVPFPRMHLSLDRDVATAWFGPPQRFKALNGATLLLNNSPEDPGGHGYTAEPGLMDARRLAAADAWTLNESRLANLRQYGIVQNELERLHTLAEELRDGASEDAAPADADARRAASLAFSQRTYLPVRGVTNDLIKAVVVLLLLAIPFSAALERLVIGSPNVYRQIIAFAAIFLAVFATLYVVHPAFRFATFPVVVLLAFVIIIMSGFVIYVMWSKFEHEVKLMQGVATASHRSTRNHRNTAAAAVSLGISTMRRRPLRTALTALTIVLLTFTLLFFGSLSSEGGVGRIYAGATQSPRQVEVTLPGARALAEDSAETLSRLWGDAAQTYVRRWAVGNGQSAFAGRTSADTVFTVGSIATLPPDDLQTFPALREAVSLDADLYAREGGILLPMSLAERIGARVGDAISLQGRTWVCRGTFDADRLQRIRTIGGLSLIPADIEAMNRLLAQQSPGDALAQQQKLAELEVSSFPLVDAQAMALVWAADGVTTLPARSLVLLPDSDAAGVAIADAVATMLGGRVTSCVGGEIERVLYSEQVSFAGLGRLVVPLLLGGLIVFGTMLSSVSDREREIFTFSAIGLAPAHVAALFFAEAAVYAVLGGMGGYLFSQIFAKVIELLAALGLAQPVPLNHSSLNAMLAMLIVMATVMVSTIYPAFRASRAANPGVQRRWKMPPPVGDVHEIKFPFTVSLYDLVGLVSFLAEYFEAHRDRTVGSFAAAGVEMHRGPSDLGLRAQLWLQPFDQGVSQSFLLRTVPSNVAGIMEIHLELRRLSGPPTIWQRSNATFIQDIREQFIFWRTIGDDLQDGYHQTTLERLDLASSDDLFKEPDPTPMARTETQQTPETVGA